MPRAKDPSWGKFSDWLKAAMDGADPPVTAGNLSRVLDHRADITTEMIYKWRRGVQHPQLRDLPAIAHAFSKDPIDLAIAMELLPISYTARVQLDMATRLSDLQSQLWDIRNKDFDERSRSALSNLLAAIIEGGEWGLAIETALEGPPEDQIQSAIRLAFRRLDGAETTHTEVWNKFKHQLKPLNATQSESGIWQDSSSAKLIRFSIAQYTRPTVGKGTEQPNCSAVVVLSTTNRSWPAVFAKRLSERLGFGLTSALDLAAIVTGKATNETLSHERAEQAFMLLRDAPARYVSYVYESTRVKDSRTIEALENLPNGKVRFVWLREDDESLEQAINNRTGSNKSEMDMDRAAAFAHRAKVDEILQERYRDRYLRVDIRMPSGKTRESDRDSIRPFRIAAALALADDTARTMQRRGWVLASKEQLEVN